MAEHGNTPDNERSVFHRTGEGDTAVGQENHTHDAWTSPWPSPILPRNHRLDGRGNGSTRAQHIHAIQRTYGNAATLRAVQRQADNSGMGSIFEQWAATGHMGKMLGQVVDSQQDKALRDAQNALTGKQPQYPEIYSPMTGPVPVPLAEIIHSGEGVPQYNNVSPTLNWLDLIPQLHDSNKSGSR